MSTIKKLECSPHFDGFEANFKSGFKNVVQINQFTNIGYIVLDSLQWNIKQG